MIEVDDEQRHRLVAADRLGDRDGAAFGERAAVEESGQLVGACERGRTGLGLAMLRGGGDEIAVAAPAEQDQRQIEQQRRQQKPVTDVGIADRAVVQEGIVDRGRQMPAPRREQQQHGE